MLRVFARDGDGAERGELTGFDELTVVDRWRDVGRWTLVTSDPDTVALLSERDAGIVVRRDDTYLMSGPIDYRQRSFSGGAQTLTVGGPDDTVHLARTLAWPKPTADVTAQSTAHDVRNGDAETVLLAYVQANLAARLGAPVVIPTSLGRGATRTGRARFVHLLDLARELLATSPSLGFRLVQRDDRRIGMEVWTASDLTTQGALFSDEVGTVLDWVYTEEAPTATRAIVGGGDEKEARMFRQRTATAAETDWSMVAEVFVDRRDVNPADSSAESELNDSGDDELLEQSPIQSFRLQIGESGLTYGTDIRIGDLVRAYPAGIQVNDRITEATITLTREGGEQVSMWVGRKDDDPDERVEKRARALDKRLRKLEGAY